MFCVHLKRMYILPLDTARKKINELEDMVAETIQNEIRELRRKYRKNNGQSIDKLWDNFREA